MTYRSDSEKITINLGHVDLGQIDLLVEERFYGNRSDFIRTAIRNQLRQHQAVIDRTAADRRLHLGLFRLDRAMLERAESAGVRLDLQVLGLLSVAADVDITLLDRSIGRVEVLGAIDAAPAIRKAILARTERIA
jgi:Arc/MetJ-type ribon-helix-helix transcriptional regulator